MHRNHLPHETSSCLAQRDRVCHEQAEGTSMSMTMALTTPHSLADERPGQVPYATQNTASICNDWGDMDPEVPSTHSPFGGHLPRAYICDGGEGMDGHPRIYLAPHPRTRKATCPYCSKLFPIQNPAD